MAIDSRQKRTSSFGDTSGELPAPDGTIGAADRAQLLWMYSGILPTPVSLIIATRTAIGRDTTHTVTGRGTTQSGGRA